MLISVYFISKHKQIQHGLSSQTCKLSSATLLHVQLPCILVSNRYHFFFFSQWQSSVCARVFACIHCTCAKLENKQINKQWHLTVLLTQTSEAKKDDDWIPPGKRCETKDDCGGSGKFDCVDGECVFKLCLESARVIYLELMFVFGV